MATRDKLRRLQKMMQGNLEGIEQRDGSTLYFDPQQSFWDTFTYFTVSMQADFDREERPEPPQVLKAVANAKDRRDAFERLMGGATHLPVNKEALVERGEFLPRSLVAGREYGDFERLEDLSEPVPEEG